MKGKCGNWAILAVAVCWALLGNSTTGTAQEVTLRVANYGGSFTESQRKYAGDVFSKLTGVRIEYIDGNPTDHLAKLIASRGRDVPFDVVYLDDDVQKNAVAAGVLAKLDTSLVPNLGNLYNEAKSKEGYGPGMIFFSVGLAYNPDKFKEAGLPEPTSWEDLWRPELAGKVAVPDLSKSYGRAFLVMAAKLAGGDEVNIEPGIDKIAQLKAHSYPASSATMGTLFQSGEIWAGPWVNGRAWGLIDKGAPLRFIHPKEGGTGHMTTIDVVEGTPHPEEAHAYLNFVLGPLPQLGQAYDIPYGPTNMLLAPVLAHYPDLARKFPSSPEDLKQLYLVDWSVINRDIAKISDLWNRRVLTQ